MILKDTEAGNYSLGGAIVFSSCGMIMHLRSKPLLEALCRAKYDISCAVSCLFHLSRNTRRRMTIGMLAGAFGHLNLPPDCMCDFAYVSQRRGMKWYYEMPGMMETWIALTCLNGGMRELIQHVAL